LQVISSSTAPAQTTELQDVMNRQVALMRRLLDDLLDLGRISHGHIELRREPISLAEFLQQAAAAAHSNFASRRQEFILRLPNESVRFMADKVRLEQIATNLLSNASKYTLQGGAIELSGGREGSEIVFRCKDNGRGILQEMQQKIFEPFTSLLTDSYGEASLGIGLSLVRHLTELHGGTVSVKSDGAEMGSEFMIRLPLIAPSDRVFAMERKSAESRDSFSIVMVEDNPVVARLMQMALEQAGHEVQRFADSTSTLAGISALKPDAVLLDIALPGMNGYELAAKLKKHRNTRTSLFIAISGFKQQERANDPFDLYLTKPVQMPALLALLAERCRAKEPESVGAQMPGLLRALLVEDHLDLSASIAALLRSEGFEVATAITGGAALKIAADWRPQVILCDMSLPDMKGLDVIRKLRSNPKMRRMYAVMITARAEAEIRVYDRRAKELGVDEFIAKPVTRNFVRALITKLDASRKGSKKQESIPG